MSLLPTYPRGWYSPSSSWSSAVGSTVGLVVSIASSGGFSETSIGSSVEPAASASCWRRRAALRASARWISGKWGGEGRPGEERRGERKGREKRGEEGEGDQGRRGGGRREERREGREERQTSQPHLSHKHISHQSQYFNLP